MNEKMKQLVANAGYRSAQQLKEKLNSLGLRYGNRAIYNYMRRPGDIPISDVDVWLVALDCEFETLKAVAD